MSDRPDRARARVKLVLLVALLVGGIAAARLTPLGDYLTRDGIGTTIDALRGSTWAPAIFIAVYATATALAIPGSILTLAGGALFGVFWGTVFNSVAANLGANAAFLIARGLGREGVRSFVGDESEGIQKLDDAVRNHGFRGLLTLRLIPLVPFNALNFGAGLLELRWSTYALATAIGILPGTAVYTFFADALLQGSREASRSAFVRVLVAGLLLVLLSLLPTLLKKMNVKLPGMAALFLALHAVPTPSAVSAAQAVPDHEEFTAVLAGVVEGRRVDYARLTAEREGLDRYVESLGSVDPTILDAAPRDEQLAFWINAYNACMLRRVVDHYPIGRPGLLTSFRNLVAGRPANSVWQIEDVFTGPHCPVAGALRSQDEIEHEIIRPMGEPRIHFAVNCAATSCPPLRAEAYAAERLDAQLDDQVRRLVASPTDFALESGETPVLTTNRVLDWYGDDFGGVEGLKRFFAGYLGEPEAQILARPETRVEYFEYDWTLNDVG